MPHIFIRTTFLAFLTAAAANPVVSSAVSQTRTDDQGRGGIMQGGRGRGGGTSGGVQRPPRDWNRTAEAVGTAEISGRVFATDTGRPLKRARVVVSGGGRPRAATTDEQGRYRLAGLPAATYSITASKAGFVDAAYGQRRALRTGTPVEVADGQHLSGLDIKLPKGGVITGHVLDEDGNPLARAIVNVLRYQWGGGEKRLAPAGNDQSDDRGQYRVFGLPPGDYFVSANAGGLDRVPPRFFGQPEPPEDETDSTGYAPTYYPGVTAAENAAHVKLATAQEIAGIDFQLQLVPLATVRGNVSGNAGNVVLVPAEGARLGQNFRAPVAQDGTFAIAGVPPGRYTAVARGEGVTAIQAITVSGADVVVSLAPVAGADVTGTVTLEAAGADVPKNFSGFRLSPMSLDSSLIAGRMPRPGEIGENGSFAAKGLPPGRYTLRASGPRGWMMKALYLNGRDITDEPLEIGTENVSDLNVIFTDRIGSISGTVRDARGTAVPGTTVIVFTTDPKLWFAQSRLIQTARTDQSGTYAVSTLPAGEYLVVATDDVEQGEWFDPEFLDEIKARAVKVTVGEADQRTRDLKVS